MYQSEINPRDRKLSKNFNKKDIQCRGLSDYRTDGRAEGQKLDCNLESRNNFHNNIEMIHKDSHFL